jgi:hypothetical protein
LSIVFGHEMTEISFPSIPSATATADEAVSSPPIVRK